MDQQEKKKNRLIKTFPQHVVPDELSLLSGYEIIIYIILFLLCLFFYRAWNKIPVIERNIQIEELGTFNHDVKNRSMASIELYIPNSVVFEDSSAHVWYTLAACNDTSHFEYSPITDSLRKEFFKRHPLAEKGYPEHLFFFSLDGKIPRTIKSVFHKEKEKKVFIDTVWKVNGETYFAYSENRLVKGHQNNIVSEQYISADEPSFLYDCYDRELQKPSFWSLRDITQSYYRIRIRSHSIDSISVRFKFKGAIDFSPMGDLVPCHVSGDLVQYEFKPNYQTKKEDNRVYINKASQDRFISDEEFLSTIQFHVKSKDMDNNQSRRVFLVTAFISALLTIFLAFIIILLYRIVKKDKE